jgi:hypothetical protein
MDQEKQRPAVSKLNEYPYSKICIRLKILILQLLRGLRTAMQRMLFMNMKAEIEILGKDLTKYVTEKLDRVIRT